MVIALFKPLVIISLILLGYTVESRIFIFSKFSKRIRQNWSEKDEGSHLYRNAVDEKKKRKRLHCNWQKERPIEGVETNERFLGHTRVPFAYINLGELWKCGVTLGQGWKFFWKSNTSVCDYF